MVLYTQKIPSSARKSSKRLIRNLKLFLAAVGVILVWRGVWWLLDLYLFPASKTLSYLVGIVLGILILILDDGVLEELKH